MIIGYAQILFVVVLDWKNYPINLFFVFFLAGWYAARDISEVPYQTGAAL